MNKNQLKSKDLGSILNLSFLGLVGLLTCLSVAACQPDKDQQEKKTGSEKISDQNVQDTKPLDYSVLAGRWLRPDGGYIVEIQKVDISGKIQAAYFNPRTINVSEALAAQKDGKIQVFIELRDVGYPGATYTLTYDETNDLLIGQYYQPAAGQTFDVQFVRKE